MKMVSNAKRTRYDVDVDVDMSSSEEDYSPDCDYQSTNNYKNEGGTNRSVRKPKCFSKNALMARENRRKKKLYLHSLEQQVSSLKDENAKLSKIVDNQSYLISDMKKDMKYLKSVIVNSSDIGKLLRAIHQNTGMSVSSSLDKLSLKNDYVPKRKLCIARKTPHPWDEPYPSYPIPEGMLISPPHSEIDMDDFLSDFPSCLLTQEGLLLESDQSNPKEDCSNVSLEEHNYTVAHHSLPETPISREDDVGVCLHVSKNGVSLEFCPTCSEKAHPFHLED